jgi:predicted RNase H-like HicB family nuclease
MKLQIALEPSDEGGYTIYVPLLPGCISEGETVDEAMGNIREAIELYLEPVEDGWIDKAGEGDYEALEETAYLLRSSRNAQRLLESIRELENGGVQNER